MSSQIDSNTSSFPKSLLEAQIKCLVKTVKYIHHQYTSSSILYRSGSSMMIYLSYVHTSKAVARTGFYQHCIAQSLLLGMISVVPKHLL